MIFKSLSRLLIAACSSLGLVSSAMAASAYTINCTHYYLNGAPMINGTTDFVKPVGQLAAYTTGQTVAFTNNPKALSSTVQNAAGYYVKGWDLDAAWGDKIPGTFTPTHYKRYGAENPLTITFTSAALGVAAPVTLDLVPSIAMMHYTLGYAPNASGTKGSAPSATDYSWSTAVTAAGKVYTRTGYEQSGWNTASDGSEVAVSFGQSVTGATFPVTNHQQSVTLYAQWTANQYTIELLAPDATNDFTRSISVTYDSTPSKIAVPPARPLYKFDGYYTSTEDGVRVFDSTGAAVGPWAYTDVTQLYARWSRYKCTVTFLKDGPGSVNLGGSHEYDSGTVISPKAIPDTYAMFIRWSDGETTETHSDIVVSSNATYTAYFANTTYVVTFNYMNTSFELKTVSQHYERGQKISPPTDYMTITGKRFEWDPAVPEYALADSAHNSKYVAETYQVYFLGNGATGGSMSPMPFEYESCKNLTPNAYTRTGYSFIGWNTDPQATTATYADGAALPKALAENLTLHAIWTPNSFAVHFDGNGATGGEMLDQPFTYDVPQTLTANGFICEGQDFLRWHDEVNDVDYYNGQLVSNLTATADATVTLKAVWSRKHYVRFDRNGATNENEMAMQTFTADETKQLSANEYGKVGYTFAGWATNDVDAANLIVTYVDRAEASFPEAKANETNILYAVWSTNHYAVAFDPGTELTDPYFFGTMESLDDCVYDTPITIRCGYTNYCSQGLLGWSRTKGGAVEFAAVESPARRGSDVIVSNLTAEADGSVTLYAVWGDVGELSKAVDISNAVLETDEDASINNIIWRAVKNYTAEAGHDDCVALNSGTSKNETPNVTRQLTTQVVGPGTLSFSWYWEPYEDSRDGALRLYVDDEKTPVTNLVRKCAWVAVDRIVVEGEGVHKIIWEYDGEIYIYKKSDKICVDDIVWTPGVAVLEVTPGGVMPKYATEEEAQAAAAKAKVVRPNPEVEAVISEADYAAMFIVSAVPTSSGPDPWTLAIELKTEISDDEQAKLDAAERAIVPVAAEATVSVTFLLRAGLYYGLAAATHLPDLKAAEPSEWFLGRGESAAVSAPRPSGTSGFYRLRMKAEPPDPK